MPTRRCLCGFCIRHGARTIADPQGLAVILLNDPARIHAYRFGLRTADFLICRECGVYGAAVTEEGGRLYATLNVNLFEARDDFPPPEPVSYEGETEAARRARRAARWTPARLVRGGEQ